jgi:hypothetical protein
MTASDFLDAPPRAREEERRMTSEKMKFPDFRSLFRKFREEMVNVPISPKPRPPALNGSP